MKKLILILFVMIFAVGINAQNLKTKTDSLPANITKWKDSQKLLNNSVIINRLKKLMGKKNYQDFKESWETLNPIVKNGNFLFSSGCLIHACGHAESAIAIDLVNKTIHVGIFREGEKTKYFNENKRKTPQKIRNWAKRLAANNKE